jgi:S-adenosylmethionine hydrolase
MEDKQAMTNVVTLTSDFGNKDFYVAEMKAAILSICPNAVIIDITHEITKYNVRMGSFTLATATPYFPEGAVHVAVIDPGVGTHRRSIAVETRKNFFVGPDNGLLILAAEKQQIVRIHEITNLRYMLPKISKTFHGRDIFAPIAAHIMNGIRIESLGPEISEVVKPDFAQPMQKGEVILGEVLHVDSFGNIITNIGKELISKIGLKSLAKIELPSCDLKLKFSKAYGEALPSEPLALIGSHGFFEISVNQGNAARRYEINSGDKIIVSAF